MLTFFRPAIALTVAFTVLTGLVYPMAITGLAQIAFPARADGSLLERGGIVIGSALIAQPFEGGGYLHPRPSASGYGAMPSGASNLGPTSAALIAQVAARRVAWEAAEGVPAPIDAVTASASGLDPHISPQTALAQVARIAAWRGADAAAVRVLIERRTEGRFLGLYGEPRVNVLLTNLALDEAYGMPPAAGEENPTP